MNASDRELADIILSLEAELRRAGTWEGEPPPPDALRSNQPFCCDTLTFAQWLQWILIPRMKVILEEGLAWPAQSNILPMAEECLNVAPQHAPGLLALIKRFDALISDGRAALS